MAVHHNGIYLWFADLVKSRDGHLTSFSGPGTFLRPSKFKIFSAFQHWAIQVRGVCYEVTSNDYGIPLEEQTYGVKISSIRNWKRRRDRHNLWYEKMKLGVTDLSDAQIVAWANFLWDSRYEPYQPMAYDVWKQNCQNFAFLLYRIIRISSEDSRITRAERDTWQEIPRMLTQYVQLQRWTMKTLTALGVGASISQAIMGPSFETLIKSLARKVVDSENAFLILSVAAAVIGSIAMARGRDYKFLKRLEKMKEEAEDLRAEQYF